MEKRTTLWLLVILTGCLSVKGTSRFPIKHGSEWTIYYEIIDWNALPLDGDEIFRLRAEGDTLINSKEYFKLYKSGQAYFNTVFNYNHVYVGAIRDENNQYFFVKKDQGAEELLYDFNLEPGDTIKSLIEKGMKVHSVELLHDGRKKIRFEKTDFQHGECTNYNNTFS